VTDNELAEFKAELDNGANPMDFKKRLARELIIQLYDEKDATVAESHFQKVVQNKELPDDIKEYTITADVTISVLVADAGLAKSRSEASRLINQGAVSIDGEKVTDINQTVNKGKIIKVGKRRYLKTV
jgi:tyrosyl-tRNA synthetase